MTLEVLYSGNLYCVLGDCLCLQGVQRKNVELYIVAWSGMVGTAHGVNFHVLRLI